MFKSKYCPKCYKRLLLANNIEYDFFDDIVYREYVCDNCGFEGKEYYQLTFIGHTNKDKRDIESSNT